MKRAKKKKYNFWSCRSGQVIIAETDRERRYILSAFHNWKREKLGDISASSRKVGDLYEIAFEGVSPAEANAMMLANKVT